ncbi:hypothetical protein DFH09DRAFT_1444641 [Mycena vulgaris]|nr:hypothetical protein DFH09DRAFT_1444641 [Mycena vulgaris]
MQFFAFVILSTALSAMASPIAPREPAKEIVARVPPGDGNVKLCTDNDLGGTCTVTNFANGACNTFAKGDSFNDKVSSVVPDPNVVCTMFSNTGCSGSSIEVTFPGVQDLDLDFQLKFNDVISSFRCFLAGA